VKKGDIAMNILMVTSEAAPYMVTSSVANIVVELSLELRRQGHDVRLIIPNYRGLQLDHEPSIIAKDIKVAIGDFTHKANVRVIDYLPDTSNYYLPIYLIENQLYFDRENFFGYFDDPERFIFFSRAVLEMILHPEFASESWKPDVIHGHNWIAGLIPFWLRHTYKEKPELKDIPFVYTLHNTVFPGIFGYRSLNVANLTDLGIYEILGESSKRINFMARGVLSADAVNTVSPQHALEIMSKKYAPSIAGAAEKRGSDIAGILNGIDYGIYNPAFDDKIKEKFGRDRLASRKENKIALQKECGFIEDPSIPLLGMVSRLVHNKGAGLLEEILPDLLREDGLQIVILGVVGDYRYREAFTKYTKEYSGRFAAFYMVDDSFARRIFSGVDIFLMPSLHEPCGLVHMIAMHYGAIPVVSKTGGLVSTVVRWDMQEIIGRGFLFDPFNSKHFLNAIQAALKLYQSDPKKWQEIQRHNMAVDFSWEKSTRKYEEIYSQAISEVQNRVVLPQGKRIEPDRGDLLAQVVLKANELSIATDRKDCLKQVARGAQRLMKSDALLIWIRDEFEPEKLSLGAYSLTRDCESHSNVPDKKWDGFRIYLEQGTRNWENEYRINPKGDPHPYRLGFLDSELARTHKWHVQLSMPVNVRGTFLGRVDAFSCDVDHKFDGQDINALEALANTIAVNLEKNRVAKWTEDLFFVNREMALSQSVFEVIRIILQNAKKLTCADRGLFHLQSGKSYLLDEKGKIKESIQTDLDDTFDFGATSDETSIRSELKNNKEETLGYVKVIKGNFKKFVPHDEIILNDLAMQGANILQATQQREERDKSRVEDLRKLSQSLIGGVDFDRLLEQVLTTISEVLQTQAASLCLIDEDTKKLKIRAAAGYHKPLLVEGAEYDIGEGTTGWIAKTGVIFKADNLEELHKKAPWKGKYLA
jgi:starch synthase